MFGVAGSRLNHVALAQFKATFSPVQLAIILRSFGFLQLSHDELFTQVYDQAPIVLAEAGEREWESVLWGFARVGFFPPKLLDIVRGESDGWCEKGGVETLCSLSWVFAKFAPMYGE